jgi:SAM-dependent methyltransferase
MHVYRQARLYDIAFSFRDIAAECDALASLCRAHRGAAPAAVLELAAGPARHAREFLRRGAQATALDLAPEMAAYARAQAAAEGRALDAVAADMTGFALPGRYDLALLVMDSASHLLDNDAVLRHLDAVARHLVPGGLYLLEMTHPRDAFRVGQSTGTEWTVEQDGVRVTTRWGRPDDPFDPVRQLDTVHVTLDWQGPDGQGQITETVTQRRFTALEFDALVRASGAFEIVEWRGSLLPDIPFDDAPAAWRMVPVLRRRDQP